MNFLIIATLFNAVLFSLAKMLTIKENFKSVVEIKTHRCMKNHDMEKMKELNAA